jgi:hypothetical protein
MMHALDRHWAEGQPSRNEAGERVNAQPGFWKTIGSGRTDFLRIYIAQPSVTGNPRRETARRHRAHSRSGVLRCDRSGERWQGERNARQERAHQGRALPARTFRGVNLPGSRRRNRHSWNSAATGYRMTAPAYMAREGRLLRSAPYGLMVAGSPWFWGDSALIPPPDCFEEVEREDPCPSRQPTT